MNDYTKAKNAFLREIKHINETVPKDKYISAYILENGEKFYLIHFNCIGYEVIELELVKELSLSAETVRKNDYCVLPPDLILLAHISTVRIYFEYQSISETNPIPHFRVGF